MTFSPFYDIHTVFNIPGTLPWQSQNMQVSSHIHPAFLLHRLRVAFPRSPDDSQAR